MNPDQIARQAIVARMNGTPMPPTTQMTPQSGMQVPQPQVVPQAPMPQRQLGDEERKENESDKLAKAVLPGTAHTDPVVVAHSKALLMKLIPYLGR